VCGGKSKCAGHLGKFLKNRYQFSFRLTTVTNVSFYMVRIISRDSQTYILSIMCDIEVLAIEMYIHLKHLDADKRGDFIQFINY